MTDQPKRTNWWIWAALALLIMVLCSAWMNWSFRKKHEESDHTERALGYNERLRLTREVALADTLLKAVKHFADSVLQAKDSVIRTREGTIKRLAGRRLPVQVIIDADSLELTRDQLENRDSTIDLQILTIGDLKAKYNIADSADRIEDAAFERKISAYNAYSRRVGIQRDSLLIANQKQEKKWRRKRRLERIGEAAVVVGIVILAL